MRKQSIPESETENDVARVRMLTVSEAAIKLGISRDIVRDLIVAGELRGITIIPESQVLELKETFDKNGGCLEYRAKPHSEATRRALETNDDEVSRPELPSINQVAIARDSLMTFSEASAQLDISRTTLNRMVKRGVLREYENQLNRRERLVSRQDVISVANKAIAVRPRSEELAL